MDDKNSELWTCLETGVPTECHQDIPKSHIFVPNGEVDFFCPALPCPAVPCPALPCPALPCLPCPCPALPCPALPSPALPCPALPCSALPCPALPCPALPSCLPCPAALPCPALPCPPLKHWSEAEKDSCSGSWFSKKSPRGGSKRWAPCKTPSSSGVSMLSLESATLSTRTGARPDSCSTVTLMQMMPATSLSDIRFLVTSRARAAVFCT